MNLHTLFQYFVSKANADTILHRTERVWKNNRWSDFDGYRQTSNDLYEYLTTAGLTTQRFDIPFDGKTVFGDARMPLGWTGRSARLEMQAPLSRVLVDRENSPFFLGCWSPSTPEEGWEGSIVCLDKGEAYELEAQPVQNSLILTPGRIDTIYAKAVEKNAAGIITYRSLIPDADDQTTNISGISSIPGGWGITNPDDAIITMAVSPQQGQELKRISADEGTRFRLTVDAELQATSVSMIDAHIEGAFPEEETWLVAPLFGPGAQYPAVSSAALVEAATMLQQGINEESLPRPMRTLRFLFLPHPLGGIAYTSLRPEPTQRALSALYLDGGAGNPDHSWSRWTLRQSPQPMRETGSTLTHRLCQEYLNAWRPQRHLDLKPFSLFPQTGFEDPCHNIPGTWLQGGSENEVRNTTLDIPDTIDPRSCIDLASVCAGIAFSQASVSLADIPLLTNWSIQQSMQHYQQDASFFIDRINEADSQSALRDIWNEAQVHLQTRTKAETDSLASMRRLDPEAAGSVEWKIVQDATRMLTDTGQTYWAMLMHHLESRTAQLGFEMDWSNETLRDNGDQRIPERIGSTIGLVTLGALPVNEWSSPVRTSPRQTLPFILSWWLIDGKRSIGEIDRLVRLEQFRFRECIPAWFTFLEKKNFIRFIEPTETPESPPETESTIVQSSN